MTLDIKRTRDYLQNLNFQELFVAQRLQQALDVERVTKKFYDEFKEKRFRFLDYIKGIDSQRDKEWYASVLLNRLMFVYFLQEQHFINTGERDYLQLKLAARQQEKQDSYYSDFLTLLFFEGFAKPEDERSAEARRKLGTIKYLNGGLFLKHAIEERWPHIAIADKAFAELFELFNKYSWNLDDSPSGKDDEISPHVLGYIFEKYVNQQKSFGAYYTRPEITQYLCEHTIHNLILEKLNERAISGTRTFDTIGELLLHLDARLCRELLDILPKISILDPACGSGAFLVSAMNTLTSIYGAITEKIRSFNDINLSEWLKQAEKEHRNLPYFIKKQIITENLFGVDLMEESTEIARLRLFLALVSSARTVDELEPLPNIDFNILSGNSLIGFLRVDAHSYNQRSKQLSLFHKSFEDAIDEKDRLLQSYRTAHDYTKFLGNQRDALLAKRAEERKHLNEQLLDEFKHFGIKYEEATWDEAKQAEGKSKKRNLTINDITQLRPFHWGYDFDTVMNVRGGFDIIITNPPWEIFKPQAKEFFSLYSDMVTKNKMRIEDFEQEQVKLLQNVETRRAWLDYQSSFPYQSAYFRAATQYKNQISTVNGKKAGTDINLYKLFTEQCYNLLREGGQCGIVIPSGIYTDLGTKQLREMLFNQTQITGLFGFENRKALFENVDSRFKFVVLTFEKGKRTETFPAAFMRHDVAELERFPKSGALPTSVALTRRLSPDSLSIMEFKTEIDVAIAQKMLKFPLLGEKLTGTWNLVLGNEFHMTNNARLFKTKPAAGRLPLYEGKMIHQFTPQWSAPRYWVDEREARAAILGRKVDEGQRLDYQCYRLAYRAIGRTTDQRALIVTIVPHSVFVGNSLIISRHFHPESGKQIINDAELLYITAMMNSFIADYFIGQKISANLNMFYIYQLPVPRLTKQDKIFGMVVERSARLICTTEEYQQLWAAVMPDTRWSPASGASDAAERLRLRAELDGIIAHLYGLTETEFQYVLASFPLIDKGTKDATLEAYRAFAFISEPPPSGSSVQAETPVQAPADTPVPQTDNKETVTTAHKEVHIVLVTEQYRDTIDFFRVLLIC